MRKVTISRRHWVSKYSSAFYGSSWMMFLWKKEQQIFAPVVFKKCKMLLKYGSAKAHAC
jgi:hypothetical protein